MRRSFSTCSRVLLIATLLLTVLLGLVSTAQNTVFAQSGLYASWNAQDSSLGHVIGRAVTGSSTDWEVQSSDGSNAMQYGPYVTTLQAGENNAIWKLLVDNNVGSQIVARLDVFDATTSNILAQVTVTRQQWNAANTFQDFSLPFTLTGTTATHSIELRIWTYGASYLRQRSVGVSRVGAVNLALNKPTTASGVCASGEEATKATDGNANTKWCALGNNGQHTLTINLQLTAGITGFTVSHAESGGEAPNYNTRDFSIQLSPNGNTWTTVVTVTGNTAAQTTHSITATNAQYVKLVTTVPSINDDAQAARIYELAVFGTGGGAVTPTSTPVFTPTPIPVSGRPTMADYWNGTARWKFDRKMTWASSGQQSVYDGSSIKIVGTTWYLFNRVVRSDLPGCQTGSPLGTQVRRSTDQGQTWSASVAVISPTPNTPWSCAATDGDVYYNSSAGPGGTWYYIIQCLEVNGGWNGCAFSRTGADPMGVFTPLPNNPVIRGHDLWDKICNASTDDCVIQTNNTPRQVFDEGTFEIFRYDGTYYWVGFHGAAIQGGTILGFRGIAKTTNFINWLAGDDAPDLPRDAILDRNDAANFNWRENWNSGGPIGAGAGSIFYDNGYYYQVSEFPDVSLGCLNNQNWNVGMFRSATLTNVNWEQYPNFGDPNHPTGNPVVYSSNAVEGSGIQPCNIQYMHLFKDPNTGIIYLAFGRRSADPQYDGIYYYRLDNTPNLLINSDFWRADTYGWGTFNVATDFSASREVNKSPDGSPYLRLRCNSDCTGDKSVYQNVNVPTNYRGLPFTFGGQFATDTGTSSLTLVVWQFDSNGVQIAANQVAYNITPGSSYANFQATGTIASNATSLRYEVYVFTPNIGFRVDNLYLIPTVGGSGAGMSINQVVVPVPVSRGTSVNGSGSSGAE